MTAITDWHSKAVLSHRISNTMDSQLVMGALNDALEKHPHPEIFNTNQGCQYTSEIRTKRLKRFKCLNIYGMAMAEPQIISALNAFGKVQNVKRFI